MSYTEEDARVLADYGWNMHQFKGPDGYHTPGRDYWVWPPTGVWLFQPNDPDAPGATRREPTAQWGLEVTHPAAEDESYMWFDTAAQAAAYHAIHGVTS